MFQRERHAASQNSIFSWYKRHLNEGRGSNHASGATSSGSAHIVIFGPIFSDVTVQTRTPEFQHGGT